MAGKTSVQGGHVYNSEKARIIGQKFTGEPFEEGGPVPPDSTLERLQRTKAGYYFVYSHGGSNTRYASRVGKEWKDDASILPLTREEADDWAQKHLTAEEWEAEFGAPAKGSMRTISVSIPEATYRFIRDQAAEQGMSMGDVIAMQFEAATREL